MSWLDNYREAKFRSAAFVVPSGENTGGRRSAVHEFPGRDVPYVQDMGRKARHHNIEAYIVDEDYQVGKNALIAALEAPGKGKLVHPYLGTLDVQCLTYSYSETVTEMGMVRFSIQFVEAGKLQNPNTVIDTTSDVASKKATALEKIKVALANSYSIARVPFSVSQNAIASIDKGLTVIEDAKKTVSAVSDFKRLLENTAGSLIALAYDAVELGQNFVELMTYGTNDDDTSPATADNAKRQIDEMRKMWDFQSVDILMDDDPSVIFANFIQQSAVINALGLISYIEFDSLDAAIALRDEIFVKLETILLSITDDELYLSLYNLQTSVIQDIDNRGSTLARLGSHTLNISLPAVVVSHSLYGNIDQEFDILARNNIDHPLFVPGSQPLEVLINA